MSSNPEPAVVSGSAVRAKFERVRDALSVCYAERDDVIEGLLVALIAKQHLCVVGPPGGAKSAIALALRKVIVDAKFFAKQLSRFTVEDDLFGPYSLAALKQDRRERVLDRHAAAAHVVVFDELFRSNGSVLDSTLGFINERIYNDNSVPLWTCLATSNTLQEDESQDAFWDRFLLRTTVEYVKSEPTFEKLISKRAPKFSAPCEIKMSEIEAAHQAAMALSPTLSGSVVAELMRLRKKLAADGVLVSDRRWIACGDVLRAAAWLDGSDEVEIDHLRVLRFTLWSKADEIPKVTSALATLDAGPIAQATTIIDDAVREWEQRPSDEATYLSVQSDLARKIEKANKQVDALVAQGVTKRAAERIERKRKALTDAYDALKADLRARLLGGSK